MNLESLDTFDPGKEYGMVFGAHLAPNGLKVLNSVQFAQAIALVAWTEESGKDWLWTWEPVIWGENHFPAQESKLDAYVEKELSTLNQEIFNSKSLSNPDDRKTARKVFSRLKRSGYKPDPDDIRRWALRDGWSVDDSEGLGQVAAHYFKNP
jgi:hypothetical protein